MHILRLPEELIAVVCGTLFWPATTPYHTLTLPLVCKAFGRACNTASARMLRLGSRLCLVADMLEAAPTGPLDDWSLGHAWGALQQALYGVGLARGDSPLWCSRLQPFVLADARGTTTLYSVTGGVVAARCAAAAAALHHLSPRARRAAEGGGGPLRTTPPARGGGGAAGGGAALCSARARTAAQTAAGRGAVRARARRARDGAGGAHGRAAAAAVVGRAGAPPAAAASAWDEPRGGWHRGHAERRPPSRGHEGALCTRARCARSRRPRG